MSLFLGWAVQVNLARGRCHNQIRNLVMAKGQSYVVWLLVLLQDSVSVDLSRPHNQGALDMPVETLFPFS